jgi:hypothetical protein
VPVRDGELGAATVHSPSMSIACLPYLHSRLVSNMVVKPAYMMSDEELQEVRAAEIQHEKELRRGRGHLHLVKPK